MEMSIWIGMGLMASLCVTQTQILSTLSSLTMTRDGRKCRTFHPRREDLNLQQRKNVPSATGTNQKGRTVRLLVLHHQNRFNPNRSANSLFNLERLTPFDVLLKGREGEGHEFPNRSTYILQVQDDTHDPHQAAKFGLILPFFFFSL